jgi:cytochrome c oxidase cbb3-type subunit 3
MSTGWSIFVTVVSILNMLACWWLIRWTMKPRVGESAEGEVTGHSWDDGHLAEYNNPMPRWWLYMFYITIVFSFIYLALYPGLGNFKGLLGWTAENQYDAEIARAEERFGPIFEQYASQDMAELAKNTEAMQVGQRLFGTYCSQCHGSDAKGAPGFPNLADNEWLYGGEPQAIKTSILQGRNGMMPPMGQAVGDDKAVDDVVAYVMSLSGMVSAEAGADGKEKFQQVCAACHMPDGTGNPALGAPNLANDSWLYVGSRGGIKQTIMEGRQGQMPAHAEFLGEAKIHVLAAYVYSLSKEQ